MEEVAAIEEGDVGRCNTVDAYRTCIQLVYPLRFRHTWDGLPTARVRSMGDLHAIVRDVSSPAFDTRDGESRREGPAAVKETILELEHTKSVSMPSGLFVDAGCDADLTVCAGSVKERRLVVDVAAGACAPVFAGAGEDMLGASSSHPQSAAGAVGGTMAVRVCLCVCE